jgi:hypothetical protein
MILIVVALENKLRSFGEVRGCNSEIRSEGALRDNQYPKKE